MIDPDFDPMEVCPCGCYNDYLIQMEQQEEVNRQREEE